MSPLWNPKVSIIIPVYNGSNYMREAIDSALAQTYKNTEVIVVNDGSADEGETDRIARSYDDRIIYIEKENGGVSSALNLGIKHMTGEYFSWLSHDDVYSPDKIQHQIDSLSSASQKNAVALCAHYFINEASQRLSKKAPKRFTDGLHTWDEAVHELLANGTFSGCALLIPKEAFSDQNLFCEELRFSQDMLMWVTVFLKGYALVYHADEDVFSRIHGKQLTQTGRKIFQKDSVFIGEILIPKLVAQENSKYGFLYLFAKRNAKYGNRQVVKACMNAAKPLGLLSLIQTVKLQVTLLYGSIRPLLRKIYYGLFIR